MMLGSLIERRQYSRQEWLAAACITSGVVFFNLSRSQTNDSQSNSLYGILLLILSLFFDGMLGACQGLLKSSAKDNNAYYRPPTATETMLSVNLYATVFLFPLSVYTREWSQGIELIRQASSFQHDILWLNAAAASGQIFIFVTITWYSSLVCTTITTTRKFFTILLSVVHFGHHFTAIQWGCVGLVFCGLYLGIVARIEKRPKKE
jgi:solute carrier family 35 (UDP-galactose transporter), member B1